jgi:beta-lysine 5,6-aminomutase beta subunit
MSENRIKPYGDTSGDGKIQLSFTLPLKLCARARKAAEKYVELLNCSNVSVVHAHEIGEGFTYFVVYADAIPTLDFETVQARSVELSHRDFNAINAFIEENFPKPLVVVGATIGTDAHTVGIDSILNMKGFDHDYGLERYSQFRVYNLGAQVGSEELLKKALETKADVILISQTVTQKDSHLRNFTEFMELVEAEELRQRFLLLIGGARINHDLAIEMGYDAGFGPGTRPSQVADYIATELAKR